MSIQRYECSTNQDYPGMIPVGDGDYVDYDQHRAELARVAREAAIAAWEESGYAASNYYTGGVDRGAIDAIVAGAIEEMLR